MTLDFTADPRDELTVADPEAATFAPTPVYARSGKKPRGRPAAGAGFGRVPKAALVALPLALVAVAAGAYYVTRPAPVPAAERAPMPRETLVASAAPAQPELPLPAETQVTPTATANSSVLTPEAAAPAPVPAVRRERPTRLAAASRPRPAPRADSALTAGEDASATIPAAPMPYSAPIGTQAPTPAAAPPPLAIPPVAAEPASPPPLPVSPQGATATP